MDRNIIPNEIYEVILDKMPICTVDIIFISPQKDKTLLFKRNNEPLKGEYFSIGGRLNKGEDFIECALRQAKQEAGLVLDSNKLKFIGVQRENYPNSAFGNISYDAVDLYFGYLLGEEEKNNIILDKQHNESKWFSLNDESLHPHIKNKVEQTIRLMEKIA